MFGDSVWVVARALALRYPTRRSLTSEIENSCKTGTTVELGGPLRGPRPGREEVADYTIEWAEKQVAGRSAT